MLFKPQILFIGPYFWKNIGLYFYSQLNRQGWHEIQQATCRIRQCNAFSSHAADDQQNVSQLTGTLKPTDAKPYSSIPGPLRYPFIGSLLDYKIGKLHFVAIS